jgi:hypothetical protein
MAQGKSALSWPRPTQRGAVNTIITVTSVQKSNIYSPCHKLFLFTHIQKIQGCSGSGQC